MIAAVMLALAAAIGVGSPGGKQLQRLAPAANGRRSALWLAPVVLLGAGMAAVWLLFGPRALGWVLTSGIVVVTFLWLVQGARRDGARLRARTETARATKTLALLLEAGQIPAVALADAAADSSVLSSVALTGRLGGDVTAAFEDLGGRPGCEGCRRVAAAWHVSERTGAPMALVLSRVAENLRRERHLAAVVAAELAAAKASGRIMALLPFVAIGMGSLVGADPLAFLFGSWPGQVALLAGTALAASGVVWTERIARSNVSPRTA